MRASSIAFQGFKKTQKTQKAFEKFVQDLYI